MPWLDVFSSLECQNNKVQKQEWLPRNNKTKYNEIDRHFRIKVEIKNQSSYLKWIC